MLTAAVDLSRDHRIDASIPTDLYIRIPFAPALLFERSARYRRQAGPLPYPKRPASSRLPYIVHKLSGSLRFSQALAMLRDVAKHGSDPGVVPASIFGAYMASYERNPLSACDRPYDRLFH